MAVDLQIKTARLISDFDGVLELVNTIEHELEKRIIARHGLTKIESLISIASMYKNEIKKQLPPQRHDEVNTLEKLLRTLRNDIDTGIRQIRNNMSGHLLQMNVTTIPDNWLFMGHSTFAILSQDLANIDTEFRTLDSGYPGAIKPAPVCPNYRAFWQMPQHLGPTTSMRSVSMQVGLWTPDVVVVLPPGSSPLDDASIRVLGLRLSIRQLGFVLLPFWGFGGAETVYERLLLEMCVNDYMSLEEAVFTGNARSGTPSLVDVWTQAVPSHPGAPFLTAQRASLFPAAATWRGSIRNKITAHMDPDIPAADLETSRWPIPPHNLNGDTNRLCDVLGAAARQDPRTQSFIHPALSITGGTPNPLNVPRWAAT